MTAVVKKKNLTSNYYNEDCQPLLEGMTLGCDPELFVVDKRGEAIYPDFIPGTKEEPYKVEGGAVQRDGMAAEINIDPATNYEDFRNNLYKVFASIKDMLPAGAELSASPSIVFSEEEWKRAPEDAKILGCTPDLDAWNLCPNPPPDGEAIPRMRTGAGHLHGGWTTGADIFDSVHIEHCADLVKQLDWWIGYPSLVRDSDTVRRSLYGKAGACRIKPYGVEYRVPSNFWLNSEKNINWIWDRFAMAVANMAGNFAPEKYGLTVFNDSPFTFNDRTVKAINTGKRDVTLEALVPYPLAMA